MFAPWVFEFFFFFFCVFFFEMHVVNYMLYVACGVCFFFVYFFELVVLQSLVLYGIYPHIVERVCALLAAGCSVGLRVFYDGNFWRVDCHFVEDVIFKSVTLVTWPVTAQWKTEVVDHVVTVLSCLNPAPSMCVVVVDEHVDVGRALAGWSVPSKAVVMRFFDVHWLQRCFRKQFKQRVGGLDPYNVLQFLKYRLSNVVNGPEFDRMLWLRQVSMIFVISGFIMFAVLLGLIEGSAC